MKKIESIIHFLRCLLSVKIYVGVRPENVSGPAIIFCPPFNSTFFCGLAGFLYLKEGGAKKDEGAVGKELSHRWAEAEKKDLKAILEIRLGTDEYLGGVASLNQMAALISHLKEKSGFKKIFSSPGEIDLLTGLSKRMCAFLRQEEAALRENAGRFITSDLETINSRLTTLKDLAWELERDILANLDKISELAGGAPVKSLGEQAIENYRALNLLLNAIDRLEVRGRDSAGLQVTFALPSLSTWEEIKSELHKKGLMGDFEKRSRIGDLYHLSISLSSALETATFTYKTFSVVGELGRNVRVLRQSIANDEIFHTFCQGKMEGVSFLAHTRWASVGAITEENCHPVNNYTPRDMDGIKVYPHYGAGRWVINAALNGDIDNYRELRGRVEREGIAFPLEVTTDTKIIPLLIERYLLEGCDLQEAFRRAVSQFEGSHAITVTSNCEPDRVYLALKGSGQALYVGIASDVFVFSSEIYGLIERTPYFVKMNGEMASDPHRPETNGQIFVLDRNRGGLFGIKALFYDGSEIHLSPADVVRAEITTRDIDRNHYAHFFLKEISESPQSVEKTLLGKYRITPEGEISFNFGPDTVPAELKEALQKGKIKEIIIIGHGTAAVAGLAVEHGLQRYLAGSGMRIESTVASEMSGFLLREDLSDTMVIPITQSGTTTDTNRAVAMARDRGAWVISIVNRRQSDITTKSHGVFYTSDGRDIEMAVASTKAFYSQVIAGHLLGLYFAKIMGTLPDETIVQEIKNLEKTVPAMREVLNVQDRIKEAAYRLARTRRYWAVVGSGPNKAASDEIRIKLSELCYKTISSDIVENKKHIDLSAEPLIIVCAAGYPEHVLSDIVKDVAIFRAHRAAVVVFADRDEERFIGLADAVIHLPAGPQPLSVIVNTMAGHLWGYFAALSLDEEARFFREFRNRLNTSMAESGFGPGAFYEIMADRRFRRMIQEFTSQLNERRRKNLLAFIDGNTLSDLTLLIKYAAGKIPLEEFWQDFPEENGYGFTPLERLDICLGQIIDELSRPIDAIRHQAKTVTVGTSRKEISLQGPIHDLIVRLGFSVKQLTSKSVFTLHRVQEAVSEIQGYTLYAIENLDVDGNPTDDSTICIVARGGISTQMKSRAEQKSPLIGTKRTITSMKHVYVGQGKLDGASIIIIPLIANDQRVGHLLLLHVQFDEGIGLRSKMDLLGYKYHDIKNTVTEYNLPWHDEYLKDIPLVRLFGEPAEIIAEEIKNRIINTGDNI